MASFVVGQNRQIAGRQQQIQAPRNQQQTRRVPQGPQNIRVRAPQPVPPRPPQTGMGNPQGAQTGMRCIGENCGTPVTPKIDAMFTRDNQGPYCKNCWAHIWVRHNWANIQDGPPCTMGVRFEGPEWRNIQQTIHDTIRDVGMATRRLPTEAEMNVVLESIKKSYVCPSCNTNIVFTLESSYFKVAGVTPGVPWPANTPMPWMQIQQQMQPQPGWPQR